MTALRPGPRHAPALALAAVCLAALWPLRAALARPAGALLGTSIDSVHHAWGLWHLAEGDVTDTFWPVGVVGTVVGGPSLLPGVLLTRWAGAAAGYTATCALQVVLALLGAAALARSLGGGPWSAPAAALFVLCGRPLLAQVGWGVPEGTAIGWLAFALTVVLSPDVDRPAAAVGRGFAAGALLASSMVENPYTVLPVALIAGATLVHRLRRRAYTRLCGEAIGGAAVLAVWAVLVHGDDGSLAASAVGHTYRVFGRSYVAEGVDGRAHLAGLLRTWEPLRYTGARVSTLLATGAADALGWCPLLLAGFAALRSRAARWALLAGAAFVALALGSFPAGDASLVPGPFFYVNFLLGEVVRPLTQPVRYLVPAGIALAVGAGLLVGRWAAEGRRARVVVALGLAAVEAGAVGGLATAIPTFGLDTWSCLGDLPPGPVASALRTPPFETTGSAALAAQIVHGQPGTHGAIGGWTARARRSAALEEALGALEDGSPPTAALRAALAQEGVATLLVDAGHAVGVSPARTCGGVVVVDLRSSAIPGGIPPTVPP